MRIISGSLGGRVLKAPAGLPTRPTTDYARSGLFNVLQHRIDFEGLEVLDLFAGIGSVSFEFSSRGAANITAVDKHPACIKFIQETCKSWKVDNVYAVKTDVFRFLESSKQKFDIIFADPPFELEDTDQIPQLVFSKTLLNKGGMLIVEHQAKRVLPEIEVPVEVRNYGNCSFSIYLMENESA